MITAGEVLKNKRDSLGKSLEAVSLDTKIQKRFLQYIEKNQFSYFDSEVFLTGFIKIYASYLNLDTDKVLALYRRSNPTKKVIVKKDKNKKIFKEDFQQRILNPKTLITASLILFLILILGYIGLQIYKFQTPPILNILEPKSDLEINSEEILVKGDTDITSVIEINGTPTDVDDQGNFEENIKLNKGVNIITIKARKNSNNALETVATRKVTYIKEEAVNEIGDEVDKLKNTLTLEIVDSSAWVKLDIDDTNELSEVVDPSKKDYTFINKFHIITGRVNNTKIYWNNEIIEWKPNQITGVAEFTCERVNDTLTCN